MQSKKDRQEYKEKVRTISRDTTSLEFPKNILEDVKKISSKIEKKEYEIRKDFRAIPTCTIDPDDAKDFDDALSVEFKKNGDIEVGVHIADVSHYVQPDTPLDEEAFKRGTSIYLAQSVVPMLPERLSNELCSLNEGVERPTFSAVFTFDKKHQLKKTWFGKTIIFSDKRFTYTKAQEILDKGEGLLYKELMTLNTLAKELCKERIQHGALILEDTELSFTYNKEGHPIGVKTKVRLETHKLVEEWMLLANKKVAELFTSKDDIFVYRIHDKPDLDKLEQVRKRAVEYKVTFPKKAENKELNKFIGQFEDEGHKTLFSRLIMRTMAKAVYSSKNIGHYGLGFKHYTHFTSPIRRYPDLIAHRLLQKKLDKKSVRISKPHFEADLLYLSERERFAQDIERSSQKDMQVLYMNDRIGEIRDGIVTGSTEYGLYVSDNESQCEGMIHVKNLGRDWALNTHLNFWKNKKTGVKIKIGEEVTFKVLKVDVEKGLIDYTLCGKK